MDSPVTITDQTPKEKPVVITSSSSKKNMFKFSLVNPKILAAMTVLLLLIGGVGTGVYLTQSPQQTTTEASIPDSVELTLRPETIETSLTSEFRVDVYANSDASEINSVDLSIKYDPAVLTLKSITPGQFLPKILIPPEIGNGNASVSLGTEGTSGASGNGIIAGLVFQANSDSPETSSTITFDTEKTKISVLNRSAENAQDTFGSAQVNIKAGLGNIESTPAAQAESEDSPSSASPEPEDSQPDAEPEASTEPGSGTTDFNNDGLTNSIDLSVLYSGWGDPETDTQKKADLNSDGIINGIDYSKFLPNFKL